MRLIDEDALCEALGITGTCKDCDHYRGWSCTDTIWADVCNAIIDAPTVDAVPVVRCRDCRFKANTIGKDEWCDLYEITVSGDHFCGDGRRA